LLTSRFDYPLPEECIAQQPVSRREAARLLAVHRPSRSHAHRNFAKLPALLRPGDLLVLNDSKVIPARLHAFKPKTGGKIELLLCRENQTNDWWTLLRPAKRLKPGDRFELLDRSGQTAGITAEVIEKSQEGHVRVGFQCIHNIVNQLETLGEVPLPPYIRRDEQGPCAQDLDRYQTVYAAQAGSLAAPTAGLHYTPQILEALRQRGVGLAFVTLHVGLGTFAPVKTEHLEDHVMHEEHFEVPAATAEALRLAQSENRRVVAAGTTSLRVLESEAAQHGGAWSARRGSTRLFLHPPAPFQVVGALQTNFHLPQSTLLMLVSAFASPEREDGIDWMLNLYREAVNNGYRFFSYGDTMLIE